MGDTDSHIEFSLDSVYTLGGVSVVAHRSMEYVDHIFGGSIVNVVHVQDPIPMMYGGNRVEPKQPLVATKKVGLSRVCINKFGQAIMDNFHKVASFGPIGTYIVCVEDEFRVLHRNEDAVGLYREHLVDGADTFLARKKWSDLPTMMDLQKYHLFTTYKENLDRIFSKYMVAIDREEQSGNTLSAVTMDDHA